MRVIDFFVKKSEQAMHVPTRCERRDVVRMYFDLLCYANAKLRALLTFFLSEKISLRCYLFGICSFRFKSLSFHT